MNHRLLNLIIIIMVKNNGCFSQHVIIMDLLDLIMDLLDHYWIILDSHMELFSSYATSIQWYKMAAGFFILQSDRVLVIDSQTILLRGYYKVVAAVGLDFSLVPFGLVFGLVWILFGLYILSIWRLKSNR